MRLALKTLATAAMPAVTPAGCETRTTRISVVCHAGHLAAEVGVTQATPTFTITGEPTPHIGSAPGAPRIQAAQAENPIGPPVRKSGGNP
jgi:hypothetical protein